jgi:hypothetical protein
LVWTGCAERTTVRVLDNNDESWAPGGPAVEIASDAAPDAMPTAGSSLGLIVGPTGGQLQHGAIRLTIPPHALSGTHLVQIDVTDEPVPWGFAQYSSVVRFKPEGLRFARPVELVLPYDGPDHRATVFWTAFGTDTLVALDTKIRDERATVRLDHFSQGFVGSACIEGPCCGQGQGELDLLLVVDNSSSMSQEQQGLVRHLPDLTRMVTTGDLDGDGRQDFPALRGLHVGVITPDLGAGGFAVENCRTSNGDDGRLQETGRLEECANSYPPVAIVGAGSSPTAQEQFARHIACVASLSAQEGPGRCNFGQPLAAARRALALSLWPGAWNAGFLRHQSILAVLVLTDKDDCSAQDTDIFNPSRDDLGPLTLRCSRHDELLESPEALANDLRSFRRNPQNLIFAAVVGVPVAVLEEATTEEGLDYEGVLAHGSMQAKPDPARPGELLPSCKTEWGRASSPRRLVEAAQHLNPQSVVQSICAADLGGSVRAFMKQVARRARGECIW